jgi:hypothetical protein
LRRSAPWHASAGWVALLLFGLMWLIVPPASAKVAENEPVGSEVERGESREAEVWEEKCHHLAFLALGTHEYEGNVTAATLGVDYEYRFSRLLGAGFVAEHALKDINATTILAVADLHIWRAFVIQAGPGVAIVSEHEEPTRTEFAFRAGVIYEIEIGRLTITPQIHYDYTTGKDGIVFGSGIGWRF